MKYLYFSAAWCGPCKMLGPVMEQVAQQIPVQKIDVDSNSQLAAQYNIRSVPTVVLIHGSGSELERYVGVQSKDFYIQQYNSKK